MQLNISHTSHYHFGAPVKSGLQQIRLRPRSNSVQTIQEWQLKIEGGKSEAAFEDQHTNLVDLISIEAGVETLTIISTGTVETRDTSGVIVPEQTFAPNWYYRKATLTTQPGPNIEALLARHERTDDDVADLHALSGLIAESIIYEAGQTNAATTVEQALETGRGVCQDHAQTFVAAARKLGFPARYVSGYLMMDNFVEQDASHAWAEVLVNGIGWIGFDVSNGICPDERYVRIAIGCDYADAAPIAGVSQGGGDQSLIVSLQVQQ